MEDLQKPTVVLFLLRFSFLAFLQQATPSTAPGLRPSLSADVQVSPQPSVSGRHWRRDRTNSLKHASSCSARRWCGCLSSALAQFQLVWSWVRCWRGPREGPGGLYQVHLLLLGDFWISCKPIASIYTHRLSPQTALKLKNMLM